VYMKLHAVLKKDLSHVLLREGEQVTVEYRIAQKLSAPVKKGSCAGVIYYKLGGMVLREYQVETTEDMEKLDFEWCLRQVLKLAV
jgi:D-alanyl-D-alanine carboxypeptidase (penicillin-binding protein 5/6)